MSTVTVKSKNIVDPPLYEGEAKFVIVRDSNGNPGIVLIHMADEKWAICRKTDSDWKNVLKRFGIQ